ncbi:MAG: AAA family ATPase, partial [Caldilineaceae bacterium]|nr:AAA family ATPase [Caldilineaceae bacterium]
PTPVPRFGDSLAVFVADLRSWVFPSQVKAARYFNLTHSTISRYENSRLTPQLGYVAHLAHLLIEQNHAVAQHDIGGVELARARQTLLAEVNQAVRWCYPGEKLFQSWDELTAVGAAYLSNPMATRSTSQPVPALPPHAQADWDAAPDVSIFYGRQPELNTLTDWVINKRCRLVSILGMGGIGKTALAHALCRRLIDEGLVGWGNVEELGWVTARQTIFNGGGALKNVDRPALTVDALVNGLLGQLLPQAAGAGRSAEERLQQLQQRLKERPHLIVIDNLETVTDVHSLLSTLRQLANPTKFLLTTRHSLFSELDVFHYVVPELSEKDALALVRIEAEWRNLPL